MARPRIPWAPAAALLLGACASLSQSQCLGGDWRAIGLADGAQGRGPERLEDHRAACAKTGVAPDAVAWAAGRAEGLRHYCTPYNAWRVGRRGALLASVCPAAAAPALQAAWAEGAAYHDIRQEIDLIRARGSWGRYGGPYYFGSHDFLINQSRIAGLRARLRALPPPPAPPPAQPPN